MDQAKAEAIADALIEDLERRGFPLAELAYDLIPDGYSPDSALEGANSVRDRFIDIIRRGALPPRSTVCPEPKH